MSPLEAGIHAFEAVNARTLMECRWDRCCATTSRAHKVRAVKPSTQSAGDARSSDFVSGNLYDKYGTSNPLYRALMARFLADCKDLLRRAEARRIVEVGCGPGDLIRELSDTSPDSYLGTDVSIEEILTARQRVETKRFLPASAERLPFPDASIDTLLACEVLEHLEEPRLAVREAARVCRRYLLASVPWEPVWRILNLSRGKYWSDLGNTPGHLQHFSRVGFRSLLAEHFDLIEERHPFPWTMILARVRSPPSDPARPEGKDASSDPVNQ